MLDAIASVFGFTEPSGDDVEVSQLFVYPIKSCRGIRLQSSSLSPRGLLYDRIFALMNSKGVSISLRCHPKMATICTAFSDCGTKLLISAPNMDTMEVPLDETEPHTEYDKIQIWDDECDVFEVSASLSEWFCRALNVTGIRFVRIAENFVRETSRKFSHAGQTALSDGFPYLLVSEKSLEEVNARLSEPVSMENFRPNIVVRNCTAFAEDSWTKVTIGGVEMSVARLCTRCILPNTHPITGVRDNNLSVTKVLREFRSGNDLGIEGEDMAMTTYFGVHLDSHNFGNKEDIVRVGDKVPVLK